MSLPAVVAPRLEAVLNEVRSVTQDLQFLSASRQHLVTSALLATIVEISLGIHAAVLRGDGTSAFVLLRSLLEAFVDLLNTAQDPQYVEYMDAAFRDQQRRILVSAVERGSKSPFLASFTEDPTAKEHLLWVRSELSQLKARGVRPLSIRERFERAGQLDYYEGPYAILCWQYHNNLNILEKRHLRQDPKGLSIVMGASLADSDTKIIVDTTAGVAANSVAAVKRLVEGREPSGLEALTCSLGELRSLWRGGT